MGETMRAKTTEFFYSSVNFEIFSNFLTVTRSLVKTKQTLSKFVELLMFCHV